MVKVRLCMSRLCLVLQARFMNPFLTLSLIVTQGKAVKAEAPFLTLVLNGIWGKDNGEIGNLREQGPLGPGPSSIAELFEQQLEYLLSSKEFC